MYQRMKMLLEGLILSMGLVVATPVSYAAETQVNGKEDIELAYVNVSKCDCNLSISGKEATCKSSVNSKSSQSIKVTMKLQKYLSGEWKTLKEWTGSTTGKTYSLSKNYTIATGTYRVRTTFKVGNETVTKNSSSVKR